MRDNLLGEEIGKVLGYKMQRRPLEELLLGNAKRASHSISDIIFHGIRVCPTLTTIDLSRCSLDYYAKTRLADSLCFVPNLKILYVDHCKMGLEGVQYLLKGLLRYCNDLKELRIGYNRFRSDDVPKLDELVAEENQDKNGIKAIRVALHGKITQTKKGEVQRNCEYPGCHADTCPAALRR